MTPKSPAEPIATSPAASGPAGSLFEGQVAAHYLMTMLAEADPRGLPGASIERIELQRSGEGYPLDDVIVRGLTLSGEATELEIQVKRTIAFSPSDTVFKDVVSQLAQAFKTLDLAHQRHQFAVATERTSFKITGPYQDVLRWARAVNSASVFFGRINRKRVGNDDMRTFVETVRTHLQSADCGGDDETVWQVLRRFQILTFDYDAPGSQSLELALERARNLLHPSDAGRASAFWKALTEMAIRHASSAGDLDRTTLLSEMTGVDGFRLLGSRRNLVPRETLDEAARQTVADLQPSIAGVTLGRAVQLNAVYQARDQSRYIEIRGAPGVGKSGLLGMLVDQVLTEGRAIVLTPERTARGGWTAFKSVLQVEGGAKAFLSDLASDGGAVLFVDSLDSYSDSEKRITVIDLVRAAASVPGFQVIVTARLDFDKDEPNWLPPDALTQLGSARRVILDELTTDEVEELKAAAPSLRALLADSHPARAVARNLFRLSRMLEVQGSESLRSEVDLLDRWWTTADGPSTQVRSRRRLIADLTDGILQGDDFVETRLEPSAVEALIKSGTLRELAQDRVAFRHDVLRDWGVAARLHEAPDKLVQLPLVTAIPSSLARGIELGARLALERSQDGDQWTNYLAQVSPNGSHGSWRRWSLLAILRSELAFSLLDRASASLMKDDGALLRELIRTTLAVESRPLAEIYVKYGVPLESVPSALYGPSNQSWGRLAQWLLSKRGDLPLNILPDVVELFQSFSVSMLFMDPITPHMAIALADWLEEVEDAKAHNPLAPNPPRFVSSFRHHDLGGLATVIRQAFLLMAASVPTRAQSYLHRLLRRRNIEFTIREIMKFRGALPQAAPEELVSLTLAGLIPKERKKSHDWNRGFTHLNSDFLPASPAHGPFLDLLKAAPEHGLRLIRTLVDYAIELRSNDRSADGDGLTLVFPTGPRFFPWHQSYSWSRNADGAYAVESSLLALEAWAHARIEDGDPLEQIISDVLGPEGSPAAFLLVAVDLLISHWPKTMEIAVPFLGSPELLALDRQRQNHDRMPAPDLGGWEAIGPKEAIGPVRLADLQKRPSRHHALEMLLGGFALGASAGREALLALLSDASARLGSPEPDDTFADPRLMARYALNVINPENWPSVDGKRKYVSPPDEARHIEALQSRHAPHTQDILIDMAIRNAIENSEQSSHELAQNAVAYAQRLSAATDEPEDVLHSRTTTIVSAATILARDGDDALLSEHENWARIVFEQVFEGKNGRTSSKFLRFNPVSIAVVGLTHLWRRRGRKTDRDALLELAGRDEPDAAIGFGASLTMIREFDPRILPSLLRCALVAQTQPIRLWDDSEDVKAAKWEQHRKSVAAIIRAEITWLDGGDPEPAWPPLPPRRVSIRRSMRISADSDEACPVEAAPDIEFYSQSAASWLQQLTRSPEAVDLNWIISFIDAYADWTAEVNGAGLGSNVDIDSRNGEWNSVFYSLFSSVLTRMESDDAEAHFMRAISVPDSVSFDLVSELTYVVDQAYFDGAGLTVDTALRLRLLLSNRLTRTVGWRREHDRTEPSVEMQIGPAIASLFFNHYTSFGGASCYLTPKGIDHVDPFFPGLARLVQEGPVPFCGLLTMNLLEVSPRRNHLDFFLSSALRWLERQPTNTQLWVDGRLGSRLTKWLESALEIDGSLRSPTHASRPQIDDVLARLVRVGVAQAHLLEKKLAGQAG